MLKHTTILCIFNTYIWFSYTMYYQAYIYLLFLLIYNHLVHTLYSLLQKEGKLIILKINIM